MLDVVWLNLVELSKHPVFRSILTKVISNSMVSMVSMVMAYSIVYHHLRSLEQRKSGNAGLMRTLQRRRTFHVDIKNHWMSSENYS